MPDDFVRDIDAIEESIDRAIIEDRAPRSDGIPIWETDADLDELYLALADAERRRDAADVLTDMCESANYEDEFNRAEHEISLIEARIEELEDREARAYERQVRSDYYASR